MVAICVAIYGGKFKDGKEYVSLTFPAAYGSNPIRIFNTKEYFETHPVKVGDVCDLFYSKEKKKFCGYRLHLD